jgi:hypothetical protein
MSDFELWLEFELGDPDEPSNSATENFANITITLSDGRKYCLNVWTFDFVPLARYPWPYKKPIDQAPARYVIPPDLLVERLDRVTIEAAVSEMLAEGELNPEWLCKEDSKEDDAEQLPDY